MTPDNGRKAGISEDSGGLNNIYGTMSVPTTIGPRGRGTTAPVMKNLLNDEASGDLRLPSPNYSKPRIPGR